MKQLVSSILFALLIASCGGGGEGTVESVIATQDLESIRAKRTELEATQKTLEEEVALLDSAIAAMDKNANLPLVTTLDVALQNFEHYLELQGDVMTKQNVLVYPEMAGTLYKVYVKEG